MKATVTGGAGFIGHHLVLALLDRGFAVTVIDDLSTGDRSRLAPAMGRITMIQASILDAAALDTAVAESDIVFHQAALASVSRSLKDPVRSNLVNVQGTIEVMLAAARHGVPRVVAAGSSSVYGIPARLPCHESFRPMPESPYGVSKLATEHYVHTLGKHLGIGTVVLRYFNVFGPGQDPKSEYAAVVPRFVTAILSGHPPTINGDPTISRDFTFVDNVVSANLLAGAAGVTGLTCNVACGQRTTLADLLQTICETVGVTVEPTIGPPRSGDIRHSLADISAARAELGYEVLVPFREGIERTVRWYRQAAPASP
jgi:UDP-glucose 4-epimerase